MSKHRICANPTQHTTVAISLLPTFSGRTSGCCWQRYSAVAQKHISFLIVHFICLNLSCSEPALILETQHKESMCDQVKQNAISALPVRWSIMMLLIMGSLWFVTLKLGGNTVKPFLEHLVYLLEMFLALSLKKWLSSHIFACASSLFNLFFWKV